MPNHNAKDDCRKCSTSIGDTALSVWEDELVNSQGTNGLPTYGRLSSITCLMAAILYVCGVTWLMWAAEAAAYVTFVKYWVETD